MSQLLINQFLADLDRLRSISGTKRETVVREAFKDLLKAWAKQHELVFIPEFEFETAAKERRYVDGALLYSLRIPLGYWEAKDEKDDLDEEIDNKKRRGYPQDNIIFEDSRTAILIQNRQEIARVSVEDTPALERLLNLFFAYERPEIAQFHKAVEQFKIDLPAVISALRGKIEGASKASKAFSAAETKFLDHARETINPSVTAADVREMLIQHILTEDIFARVFDDGEFHRQNNIAKELYALEEKFFTGATKKQTLKQLEPYYAAIRTAASQIPSHAQKQTFLKVIYENFYKVYNPKGADRLGVIYTPNEIVRFMIESADWLCEKHFGKNLVDPGVEILDPATGTGTFVCELLEHFRGQWEKLAHKYKEELHANEVAILPYYVANLNIEATYAAITGQYAEYPNLCFVDTLDNVAGLGKFSGHQEELFGAMSDENVARIKRQNERKISVIIGNPPYNANQQNENDNNKNREYPRIDARIKATYIAESTAQKTKLYDMYTRFFRWASDRIKDEGIITFVTNRSFIDRRSFDGFRKTIEKEFDYIYVIDLGGDIRELSGKDGIFLNEEHTIFGVAAAVGICITFLVRAPRKSELPAAIYYVHPCDIRATRDEKFDYLQLNKFQQISFQRVHPDLRASWINQGLEEFSTFIPIASKHVKDGITGSGDHAIFKLFSLGVSTNRDEWVYDFSASALAKKVRHLTEIYEAQLGASDYNLAVKWSRNLKRRLAQRRKEPFTTKRIVSSEYRPFTRRELYGSDLFIDENGARSVMFPKDGQNQSICFSDAGFRSSFCALTVNGPADLHFGAAVDAYQQVPRYRYTPDGSRLDNITDWALEQFRVHYPEDARPITKDAIFRYVYAVLHDPIYRDKYALNLKREFPRIPFYADFWRWADWGERLMALHIGYEGVEPWPLKRTDTKDKKSARAGLMPKAMLKADKEHGIIVLDSETQLSGVPPQAWNYRLGNRSGLEWILDQHKEKTPKDPTIRAKFNTYRFADYKEKVIDLLARVARVSVETVEIVEAMRTSER
jgi:predicted helicase